MATQRLHRFHLKTTFYNIFLFFFEKTFGGTKNYPYLCTKKERYAHNTLSVWITILLLF